jgi:tetraacyldisaccharide 4'-kinase
MARVPTQTLLNPSTEQEFLDLVSDNNRSATAAALRSLLWGAQQPYSVAVGARNIFYDRRWLPVHRLPRPTISVGNLTTGGTGKTPFVCWLVAALQAASRRPAVLMRGYKSNQQFSDEQALISRLCPGTTVIADPDRVRGSIAALGKDPALDLFILDDGMQHRRVWRDLDIVLISAVSPWGYGHLLPRGLLREPPSSLRRSGAVIITHCSEVDAATLAAIESTVRRYNASCPIFHADHTITSLVSSGVNAQLPLSVLSEKKYFAACGIGQPQSFLANLASHGSECAGHHFFPDHYHFTENDVAQIRRQAAQVSAEMIVVTEKDWTKLCSLPAISAAGIPIYAARLQFRLKSDEEQPLLDLVQRSAPK